MILIRHDEVTRVSFDYQTRILVLSGAEVQIGTSFTLADSAGTLTLDPESIGRDAGLVVERLLHKQIDQVETSEDGTLVLSLVDGVTVTVRPHGDYEAWQISESNGALTVCLPSGGLAVWGPAEP